MVQTTVRPVEAMLRSARTTEAAARESRPVVGSSAKRTDGLEASSTPSVRRLRSPGASEATAREASEVSSSTVRTSAT